MRYTVLLYADATLDTGPEVAEWAASLPAHTAFGERLAAGGIQMLAGGALQGAAAATSLRVRGGERLLTDGPFAETKEQLWGFYLLEAPDLDAVLAACEGLWEAEHGTVEVRPVIAVDAPVAA